MSYKKKLHQPSVRQVVMSVLCSSLLLSCSNSEDNDREDKKIKPDYLALETDKMDSTLNQSTYLEEYKAGKAVLRALGSDNKPAVLNSKLYTTAGKMAFRILNDDFPSNEELLMNAPLLMEAKAIYDDFPQKLYDLNEADYQPILYSAINVLDEDQPEFEWNASYEHLLLSIVTRYAQMPASYTLYEISQVDPESIGDNEVKTLAYLYKAISFSEHGLPYHAAENASFARETLEQTSKLSSTFTNSFLIESDDMNPEATKERFRQVCLLVEGLAHMQMQDKDDRKKGIPLLKTYVESGNKHAVVDEWTILSELVVQMQQSRYDATDPLLDKYSRHKNLSFTEKSALLAERKKASSEEAAGLRNIIITGIIAEKLYRYVQKTDWFNKLGDHPVGEGMIKAFDRIEKMEERLGDLSTLQSFF